MKITWTIIFVLILNGCGKQAMQFPFDVSKEVIPKHEVVSLKYYNSDPDIISYSCEVIVEPGLDKSKIELIAKSIIQSFDKPHFLAILLFHKSKSDIGKDFTVAMVHWAHKGEDTEIWKSGDYRQYILTTTLK